MREATATKAELGVLEFQHLLDELCNPHSTGATLIEEAALLDNNPWRHLLVKPKPAHSVKMLIIKSSDSLSARQLGLNISRFLNGGGSVRSREIISVTLYLLAGYRQKMNEEFDQEQQISLGIEFKDVRKTEINSGHVVFSGFQRFAHLFGGTPNKLIEALHTATSDFSASGQSIWFEHVFTHSNSR